MSCLIEFYLSWEQKDIETNNTTGRKFHLEFFTTEEHIGASTSNQPTLYFHSVNKNEASVGRRGILAGQQD